MSGRARQLLALVAWGVAGGLGGLLVRSVLEGSRIVWEPWSAALVGAGVLMVASGAVGVLGGALWPAAWTPPSGSGRPRRGRWSALGRARADLDGPGAGGAANAVLHEELRAAAGDRQAGPTASPAEFPGEAATGSRRASTQAAMARAEDALGLHPAPGADPGGTVGR